MSASLVNRVYKIRTITPVQKAILIYLADRYSDAKGCYPSIELIHQDLGWSVASIKRSLKELAALKLIVPRKKMAGGRCIRTYYDILPDGVSVNGSQSLMVSDSQADGFTQSCIYNEGTFKEQDTADAGLETSDHNRLFEHHRSRIQTVTNRPAQGAAIKRILTTFPADDALRCYQDQVANLKANGGWRERVDWITVEKALPDWKYNDKPPGEALPSVQERLAQNATRSIRKAPPIRDYQILAGGVACA